MRIDPEGPLAPFHYDLPAELIAQAPADRRDASRLMVLERATGRREHRVFADVLDHLRPGDVLVLNDTRVFPARLRAQRRTGGRVEIFLLEARPGGAWSALARPARTLKPGEELPLQPPSLAAGAVARFVAREDERVIVELRQDGEVMSQDAAIELCARVGETPLPPYIRRPPGAGRDAVDRERYQTVYARSTGSVAAPTAGLHFTPELLERARTRGIEISTVRLHVGLATFQPLTAAGLAQDELHEEVAEVEAGAAEAIRAARREGRRVVAVGTTTVRAVESFLAAGISPFRGRTRLFIKPGYRFLGVDALITNFHLPCSSLLVLVAAFAGRERILDAYRDAIEQGYRFYSFGDAMLIV